MAVTEFAIHLLISETIEVISPERLVTLRNYTHPVIWRILSLRDSYLPVLELEFRNCF